jgi:propanediol dehydratase large subunit
MNAMDQREPPTPNRWRRFDEWDARPLRQDRFAEEAPEQGFCAIGSPFDPRSSCSVRAGRVTVLDGKAEPDFDLIDEFVARHHLDPAVVDEAMTLLPLDVARMLVDIHVPREELQRLATGMTPARLAEVVAEMSALEITFAFAKMRSRQRPGNQAHVTNAKDDPLQLAADAATAAALGFDEIETTMRVASNSWANALACTVGSAVGRGSVLFQCSIEEAEELRIGMSGLASYAETVSVYGTEQSFIDGDDTPWSKAFLAAAYASRGIKARCTSGGASELLMGFHERKSILYLEARCLCLQRAMGIQGTQNGGVDGASLTASLPSGVRELMAENLLAVWLGLECASGNDVRTSSSEIRVGAKIAPFLLAGSEFICSGFGSIKGYDNSFNVSLFNGEDIEDYLVLQRDFRVDGGLTAIGEDEAIDLRTRAVDAITAVLEELDLAHPTAAMRRSVVFASGSDETEGYEPGAVTPMSEAIDARGITAVDVVRALAKRGFVAEAEHVLLMLRQRVSGDYLQTSAIIRDGRVISAINDPNRYAGPGTGYQMSEERWAKIKRLRGTLSRKDVLAGQAIRGTEERRRYTLENMGPAALGADPLEVVIGVSPGFGKELHETTAGHPLSAVVRALMAGIAEGGGRARFVRCRHTADTSFLGLTAAKLSGSGIGIGIQAKGTTVLHRSDRLPHLNLELFSNAPVTSLAHYQALARNAALHARGQRPDPVVVPSHGQALSARFHVQVALIHAVETALTEAGAPPIEVKPVFLRETVA